MNFVMSVFSKRTILSCQKLRYWGSRRSLLDPPLYNINPLFCDLSTSLFSKRRAAATAEHITAVSHSSRDQWEQRWPWSLLFLVYIFKIYNQSLKNGDPEKPRIPGCNGFFWDAETDIKCNLTAKSQHQR